MKILLNSIIRPAIGVFAIAVMFATGCSAQNNVATTSLLASTGTSTVQDDAHPGLMDPSKATEKAPEKFLAKFKTTQGDFTVEVTRSWSPNGADRFYNMVRIGYFNDIAIFRAVPGFMFQFGVHGDPAIASKWSDSNFKDDPRKNKSNVPGTLSFAQTGRPNTRSVQMFVNLGNNSFLDTQPVPFTPFGKVIEGMTTVGNINTEYGENPKNENIQGDLKTQGNAFIRKRFPNIDFIKSVEIVTPKKPAGSDTKPAGSDKKASKGSSK